MLLLFQKEEREQSKVKANLFEDIINQKEDLAELHGNKSTTKH